MTRKTITAALAFALSIITLTSSASAEPNAGEIRAQFKKLVSERNNLHKQLHELDIKAARLMKQQKDATRVFAEQAAVQDRLDNVRARLEIFSLKHSLTIPPEPAITRADAKDSERDAEIAMAERVLGRGRQRAIRSLQDDCLRLLKSLDLQAWLNHEAR